MNTTAKKQAVTDFQEPKAPKSLIREMASKYHIDPAKFLDTLKHTAFQQKEGQDISNEQMQMLLVVANEYNLNPFLKQIYAFPDKKNGIIPIVGVDGYIRIVNEHPQADGWEFKLADTLVDIDNYAQGIPEWIECIMHRKDRQHSITARVWAREAYRPPFTVDQLCIRSCWWGARLPR